MAMKFDIVKALKTIFLVTALTLTLIVVVLIAILVTGVIAQVGPDIIGNSSNESANPTAHTAFNNTVDTILTWFTTLTSAGTTTMGLVVLVVILIIFGGFLAGASGDKKKKGDSF